MEKTTKKEIIVTILLTVFIIGYPLAMMTVLLIFRPEFTGNVILEWERYEIVYMGNFIVIALLLVISTQFTLSHMRRVFGEQSMKEEKPIKVMLLLFCGTYTVRVAFAITLYFNETWVHRLFSNEHSLFMFSVLVLWALWDSLPLTTMLVIHYKNFTSFTNEEILYTEYSVDDANSHDGYQMFDPSVEYANNNLLETSGVINLESSDSDTETEIGDSMIDLDVRGASVLKKSSNSKQRAVSVQKNNELSFSLNQPGMVDKLKSDYSGESQPQTLLKDKQNSYGQSSTEYLKKGKSRS